MMNFFSNFFKFLRVRDDTEINMGTIKVFENDCASEEQLSCNIVCENNSIVSEDISSDLNLSQTFSEHSDRRATLSKFNYSSNSDEIQPIDFEELIDSTHQLQATEPAKNIKEFENFITSYKIPRKQIRDSVLCLNENNEYLNVNSENKRDNEIFILDKQCKESVGNKENYIDLMKQTNRGIKLEKSNCIESTEVCDFDKHNNCDINNNGIIENTNNNLFINDAISSKESNDFYLDTTITRNDEMQDIDDDGYNSSDFEFITENEAKIDLYNYNYKISKENINNISREDSVVTIKSEINNIKSPAYSSYSDLSVQENISNEEIDPGEGSSGLNKPTDGCFNEDYRENHSVPEGEDYLDLFRGQYNPVLTLSDIIFLENKSTRPLPMNVQYEGIGFDLRLMRHENEPDNSVGQYTDEAKETIKRILLEYPGENRKKRRKF